MLRFECDARLKEDDFNETEVGRTKWPVNIEFSPPQWHPAPLTILRMTYESRDEIDSLLIRKSRAVTRNSYRRIAATDSLGHTD